MPSFKLINSESKPLTHELAAQFAAMEASPTERELNPARLKHLRKKAEDGLLVSFNWSKAKLGDKHLRMNGQHSSTVLSELNGSFPQGLMAHIDEYEVDDLDGLALLFRQFDDRKSSRSVGDIAGAYQGLYPELDSIPRPIAKLGIEGVAWYRREVEGILHPSGDEVFKMFNQKSLHGFLLWLGEVFNIKTPELRRKEVVAAMYATWFTNETAAHQFWDAVARGGVGYDEESPETVLDNWLRLAKEKELKDELKPGQYYQGCVYAWNALREGKTIKEIKSDTKKGLMIIK